MKKIFQLARLIFCFLIFSSLTPINLFGQANFSIKFSVENPAVKAKIFGTTEREMVSKVDTPFIVSYALKENADSIMLFYDCPYVSSFYKTGVIAALEFNQTPFHFHYPNVTISLTNNAGETLEISRLELVVNKTTIDKRPIIVIPDKSVNQIILLNEGWGKVIKPVSKIKIIDLESYESGQLLTKTKEYTVQLPAFDSLAVIDIDSLVPFRLKRQKAVGALGSLAFTTESGEQRLIRYGTRVILSASATAPPGDVEHFDIFLPSGKTGYSRNVDWKRSLKTGAVDRLRLSFATDKTSDFDVVVNVYNSNNKILMSKKLKASIFVPRSISRNYGLNKQF